MLQGPGSRYTAAVIELDLTKAGSLVERMQEALALFGHVDILINNAGMMTTYTFLVKPNFGHYNYRSELKR